MQDAYFRCDNQYYTIMPANFMIMVRMIFLNEEQPFTSCLMFNDHFFSGKMRTINIYLAGFFEDRSSVRKVAVESRLSQVDS